jgi:hypothetical protein
MRAALRTVEIGYRRARWGTKLSWLRCLQKKHPKGHLDVPKEDEDRHKVGRTSWCGRLVSADDLGPTAMYA